MGIIGAFPDLYPFIVNNMARHAQMLVARRISAQGTHLFVALLRTYPSCFWPSRLKVTCVH
jgi:hypothetical protein